MVTAPFLRLALFRRRQRRHHRRPPNRQMMNRRRAVQKQTLLALAQVLAARRMNLMTRTAAMLAALAIRNQSGRKA